MTDSDQWRTVEFSYRLPEGADWDEHCPADWVGSGGPMAMDDDDIGTER